MQALAQRESHAGGRFWAWLPVLLLGTLLSGLAVMAFIATHDPSFALEPDYYQKALAWDAHQEQEARNRDLGWKLEAVELSATPQLHSLSLAIRLNDANRKPISGAEVHVTAFPNVQASRIRECALKEREPGVYGAELDSSQPGIWELRFDVTQANFHYTSTARTEVQVRGRK